MKVKVILDNALTDRRLINYLLKQFDMTYQELKEQYKGGLDD